MEPILYIVDMIINLDDKLAIIVPRFGFWIYLILFLNTFAETGLVVTPFLPGDSLLFVAGTLAARGILEHRLLFGLFFIATVLGDMANYQIGRFLGIKVFRKNIRILSQENLERTQLFYEKHGGKAILLARFLPIIRTVAPFVAGIGSMPYGRFTLYNVIGGFLWVSAYFLGGYFFGYLPLVQEHFVIVILVVILVSTMPGLIAYVKGRFRREKES